jgi:hypothetical protein
MAEALAPTRAGPSRGAPSGAFVAQQPGSVRHAPAHLVDRVCLHLGWARPCLSRLLELPAGEGAHLGAVVARDGAADRVRERVPLRTRAPGESLHTPTGPDGRPRIRPPARIKDLTYSQLPAPAHAPRDRPRRSVARAGGRSAPITGPESPGVSYGTCCVPGCQNARLIGGRPRSLLCEDRHCKASNPNPHTRCYSECKGLVKSQWADFMGSVGMSIGIR